ncbi:hypothetical protein CN151_02725 [Sinorhizobium meliloti]|uniref:Uncharacterized protein n=2 Tax=Rhizobium meliloti TaxID=382 RepID=F7X595_SINMM|nr:hypothetical protein SinmeB_3462 [Sinorhizobium meliloti BL225C]AEG55389.1 hypothetical protein Sinme_3686 [Sinorhizobium meliloti AK83]AEH81059.1 hypothetical protein SM11_chr3833 [Sinorhizobium meliloti SM11]AGA05340.1 hypothetical protein C770_GR4Chr0364 [Sinorhizobium meliloti GR4]AIL98209.1 hypothetical protein DU99_01910 [Sinorhizobium meliloti]ARS69973.1 hypothetical protein SMRU11_23130 [Sinorhizobium meliloti RU11/001]PST29408.1 hypothetical protein C7U62_02085 [Mesorhizobium loti
MPDGSRAVMVAKVAPRVSFAPPAGRRWPAGRMRGRLRRCGPANFAWDKEAKMEHPFYRCNG